MTYPILPKEVEAAKEKADATDPQFVNATTLCHLRASLLQRARMAHVVRDEAASPCGQTDCAAVLSTGVDFVGFVCNRCTR